MEVVVAAKIPQLNYMATSDGVQSLGHIVLMRKHDVSGPPGLDTWKAHMHTPSCSIPLLTLA